MKLVMIAISMMFMGSMSLANGGPYQPRKDYDNAGYYQPELDASVVWMAQVHNMTAAAVKANYSFYWQFPISFEPSSLTIYFYGQADTCRVNADDVHQIEGVCYPVEQ